MGAASHETHEDRARAVFGDEEEEAIILAPTNVPDGTLSAAYITMSLFMLVVCMTGFAGCAAWLADSLGVTSHMAPTALSKFASAVSYLGLVMGLLAVWFFVKDAPIALRQVANWAKHGVPGTGRAHDSKPEVPATDSGAVAPVEAGWGMWVGEVAVIGLVAPALWYGPALVRDATQ